MPRPVSLVLLLALTSAAAAAGDGADALFVRRIQPLIAEKCVACHGEDPAKIKSDYDMRTREGFFRGGESGVAAVVPGQPDKSPVYLSVLRNHDDWEPMPPKEADKLYAEQIAWIKDWIAGGVATGVCACSPAENERIRAMTDEVVRNFMR